MGKRKRIVYNVSMDKINMILMGYGNVGRAFMDLVIEKTGWLQNRYSLHPRPIAVFRKNHSWLCSECFSVGPQPEKWESRSDLKSILNEYKSGVLVECTPSTGGDGDPGITHLQTAMENGWHTVTANKSPLVYGFEKLAALAAENGVKMKISGATGAALPAADIILRSLAGTRIEKIEGIFNGTSNYILTRMGEGFSYEEALRESQSKGIAETDPSQDVGGWDTAFKILILTNAFFGSGLTLRDVKIRGIDRLDEEKGGIRGSGQKLKLLGVCVYDGNHVRLKVEPAFLSEDHPLYAIDGTEKGLVVWTDTMGKIVVSGGKSDPRGAAAALLKDIISLYTQESV